MSSNQGDSQAAIDKNGVEFEGAAAEHTTSTETTGDNTTHLEEGATSLGSTPAENSITNINIQTSDGLNLLCKFVDFSEISFKEVCFVYKYSVEL